MKYPFIHLLTFTLLSFSPLTMSAQNVETLTKKSKFTVNGGLRFGLSFYDSGSDAARRSPFAYVLSGSTTFSWKGFQLPFSISYRDQKFSLSKPFFRAGASPYWKWIKIHAGYRNLSWSDYTLAGHTFLGGGIELTPGKFRIAAMSGKLQNIVVQSDSLVVGANLLNTYERKAYGAKIGYGGDASFIDLILFRAYDDLSKPILDSIPLKPQDNLTIGLNFKIQFFKIVNLYANTGASLFTRNTDFDVEEINDDIESLPFVNTAQKITTINGTTRAGFGGDAGIRFNFKAFQIGGEYKRVEPYFNTLGAYYLRTDYENIRGNISFRLFKGKVALRGSYGVQRNNLRNDRSFTNWRRIGSGFLTIAPSPSYGISASYSNFQTDQQAGILAVNDTLRLAVVGEQMNVSPYFNIKREKATQSISLNLTRFTFNDVNEFRENPIENENFSAFASYRIKYDKTNWSINFGANYSSTIFSNVENTRYGGTVGVGKLFFDKKLSTRLHTTFNLNQENAQSNGYTQNSRLSIRWKFNKKNSLNFNLSHLNKNTKTKGFSEWRGRISYAFRF